MCVCVCVCVIPNFKLKDFHFKSGKVSRSKNLLV